MDRWQIAAVALAVGLMLAWFWTLPAPPEPPASPAPGEIAAESETPPLPPLPVTPEERLTRPSDATRQKMTHRQVNLDNDAVRLEIDTEGGRIVSAQLKRFRDRVGDGAGPVELVTWPERGALALFLGSGALEGTESLPYEVVRSDGHSVELAGAVNGVRIERSVELDSSGYGGRLRLRVENDGSQPLRPEFRLAWYALERPSDDPTRFLNYALVAAAADRIERRPVKDLGRQGYLDQILSRRPWSGDTVGPPCEWGGTESQYFLSAALPENASETRAFLGPNGIDAGLAVLGSPLVEIPPGQYVERSYRLYFGPKLRDELVSVDPRLGDSIQAGWSVFRPLVDLFAFLLVWTHDNVVGNYGVAIILLTVLLRAATYPLTQRSMKSMKRFSEIAPEMKKIQEKHKGNRDRTYQETMALYQRTGINPLTAMGGGCLPMLIQFPFLIALYFALQASIDLRHAHFMLWIDDLSAPETLVSVAGLPIRVLPLLMGATMVAQNRLTPATNVDPQQRQMMMWMSVFFVFLFYQFPSGLVLYWFVSNLLGIAQQLWVNRQSATRRKA